MAADRAPARSQWSGAARGRGGEGGEHDMEMAPSPFGRGGRWRLVGGLRVEARRDARVGGRAVPCRPNRGLARACGRPTRRGGVSGGRRRSGGDAGWVVWITWE